MSRFDYSDQLFENVPTDEPVVVAVSGGSDSMALLLLAHSWAQKHDVELHAVTIDHGLRAEAAAEAAYVAGICARMNLQHTVLAWDGMKPSFGIQEAARLNRYALMDDYAHEVGAGTILTGHTADDQAETVLMRAERRREDGESDGRGLAGMAGVTGLFGGTKVVRPLLHVSRNALRDFLSRHGQAWIEDPSNHDESFERVRLRQRLAAAPGERERLLALAAASAGLRRATCQ